MSTCLDTLEGLIFTFWTSLNSCTKLRFSLQKSVTMLWFSVLCGHIWGLTFLRRWRLSQVSKPPSWYPTAFIFKIFNHPFETLCVFMNITTMPDLFLLAAPKPRILVVMHHTIDPHFTEADIWKVLRKLDVLLVVNCLFFEGKLLDCKLNVASYAKISKAIATSCQDHTKKVKTSDFLPLSPQKCFILIFILHSFACCLEHHYWW